MLAVDSEKIIVQQFAPAENLFRIQALQLISGKKFFFGDVHGAADFPYLYAFFLYPHPDEFSQVDIFIIFHTSFVFYRVVILSKVFTIHLIKHFPEDKIKIM